MICTVFEFNSDQQALIKKLGFDPSSDFDKDANEALLDAVADHLMAYGFDADYAANKLGDTCEDIITIITKEY